MKDNKLHSVISRRPGSLVKMLVYLLCKIPVNIKKNYKFTQNVNRFTLKVTEVTALNKQIHGITHIYFVSSLLVTKSRSWPYTSSNPIHSHLYKRSAIKLYNCASRYLPRLCILMEDCVTVWRSEVSTAVISRESLVQQILDKCVLHLLTPSSHIPSISIALFWFKVLIGQ